jgi:hypothetical protein
LIQSIKERIEKSDPQEGLWNIIKAEIRQFETKVHIKLYLPSDLYLEQQNFYR